MQPLSMRAFDLWGCKPGSNKVSGIPGASQLIKRWSLEQNAGRDGSEQRAGHIDQGLDLNRELGNFIVRSDERTIALTAVRSERYGASGELRVSFLSGPTDRHDDSQP